MALADPLGERARDAVFVQPFNAKRKTAHGARDAPLGNLAAPRHQAGKGTPKMKIRVFSFYETRTRFFLCPYLFSSQRRGAVFFPPPCFSRAFNTDSTKQFSSRRRLRRKKTWRVKSKEAGRVASLENEKFAPRGLLRAELFQNSAFVASCARRHNRSR